MTQKSGIQPKLLCPDKLAYVCVKPLLESGQKNIYVVTSTNDGTHKVVEQGVGTDATVQLSLSGFNKSPRITLVDVSIAIPEIVRVSAGGTGEGANVTLIADGCMNGDKVLYSDTLKNADSQTGKSLQQLLASLGRIEVAVGIASTSGSDGPSTWTTSGFPSNTTYESTPVSSTESSTFTSPSNGTTSTATFSSTFSEISTYNTTWVTATASPSSTWSSSEAVSGTSLGPSYLSTSGGDSTTSGTTTSK